MRQLHVVAVSEDGRHVVLAARAGSTRAAFRVALDERLAAAVRGDLPRPGDPEGPELTPKEIQTRLRSGESSESIALSAGVPVTRVERFSGPVQGEMARMIDATRSTHLVRGRLGRSDLPLGRAVDMALQAAPSLRPESVEWSTFRDDDGLWVVTVSWFARARTRTASWRYDPATRTVTATDTQAAALAHHDASAPPRRRRTAAEPGASAPTSQGSSGGRAKPAVKRAATKTAKKAPAKKAPAAKVPARKAPAAKAPARKAAAAKAPATKVPAKKAAAAKSLAKKVPATKVPAKKPSATKAPATKAPAAKAPARKAPAKKAPATRAPAAKAPAKAPPPRRGLRVVPDPPARSRRAAREAAADGVKSRASVPGWADVLLGTSPGGKR